MQALLSPLGLGLALLWSFAVLTSVQLTVRLIMAFSSGARKTVPSDRLFSVPSWARCRAARHDPGASIVAKKHEKVHFESPPQGIFCRETPFEGTSDREFVPPALALRDPTEPIY